MNITLDQSVEMVSDKPGDKLGFVVIRGNSIEMLECLEEMNN
jgi:small nuclear ribonucleoprotein (snRNP)-like protein